MSRNDSQLTPQGGTGTPAPLGAKHNPKDGTARPETQQAHQNPAQDVRWLTDEEQQVWRQWLDLGARITNALSRELQLDSTISLADYEVLVYLSESPDHRQRVVALAEAIKWERSRLSHQITRMAKRGLVRRESCDNDGRGAFVILEEQGLEAITAAAPGHVEAVRHMMFDGLSAEQLAAFRDVLAHIEPQVADQEERIAAALAAKRGRGKAQS
ncbi:MarR family transcriptional regulator [Corynebacterium sp. UMB4614]|uniref:MarR family winged helix-turn-helix transcriptional regulator n=1 Tax=Corynebacterium sp. UMB4614 TaxID=3046334 RepID=UPI00254AD1B4|nr:MarR family transcriptional regulator [Corynebacterium sp. UMB4614]MDK7135498.1 MarR family transcriptional regulator [Corynebacterium sp. UMB4614]